MIVDTSALVAVLRRENGADRLIDHLLAGTEVRISAGTLLETRIVAERDGGTAELEELLEARIPLYPKLRPRRSRRP